MLHLKRNVLACLALLLGTGTAHAVLIDRGGGLIYDTDLNVTWLQDAQYAVTSGATASGMTWAAAKDWADGLQYYDAVRDVTYSDWRLPGTINLASSAGFDTTGLSSELAYMYYVNLGYAANQSFLTTDPAPTSGNYNPFVNMAYLGYWSGTDALIPDRQRAWAFHFHFGWQFRDDQADRLRVWAVRDGDVGSAVPEPEDSILFCLGMAGILVAGRRRATTA